MSSEKAKFSLLFVDDEPSVIASLKRVFFETDYEICLASSGSDALKLLEERHVDVALVDLMMPGMDGLTLLGRLKEIHPEVAVIMITGRGGVREAVEAMKLGAVDFIEKPFSPESLLARVAQLHRIWQLERDNRRLKEQTSFRFGMDEMVGNSKPMRDLKEEILQVGPTDVPVLIIGETGTGKELAVRAIHRHSKRSRGGGFVPVDCTAISETVIESELFGHVKGAFTGAHESAEGLIRSADKGTLFLDEVRELSPGIQAKLLRAIQEKEVRPVGSNRWHRVDFRVVAATNRNLDEEVSRGNFREDLFYRLNVVTLKVPPLRERKDDIGLLARHFLEKIKSEALPVKGISGTALSCLENYHWPGNIRELENAVRRAAVLCRGERILFEDLPETVRSRALKSVPGEGRPADRTLSAVEKAAIEEALARCGNNRKKAAEILGVGEATIYRKIRKYGIGSD